MRRVFVIAIALLIAGGASALAYPKGLVLRPLTPPNSPLFTHGFQVISVSAANWGAPIPNLDLTVALEPGLKLGFVERGLHEQAPVKKSPRLLTAHFATFRAAPMSTPAYRRFWGYILDVHIESAGAAVGTRPCVTVTMTARTIKTVSRRACLLVKP